MSASVSVSASALPSSYVPHPYRLPISGRPRNRLLPARTRWPGCRVAAGGARLLLSIWIALLCSLDGCATPFHWVKDGFTAQHADARLAACQLEAERLRYFSEESDEQRDTRTHHEASLCMKADGWHWVQGDSDSASESASDKTELATRAGAQRPEQEPSGDSDDPKKPAGVAAPAAAAKSDEKLDEKPASGAAGRAGEADDDDEEEDDEE